VDERDLTGPPAFRRILAFVAAAGAVHVASMLHATGGRLSLPVDDSFIYFRYAQELAGGHPLVYQPGDAPTTGATSLPWVAVLAVGALLGFLGKSMLFWALPWGGLLLAVTARWSAAAQRALAPRREGSERPGDLALAGIPLAGALVLLSGPLEWGAWSGMEIALTAAAVAAAFLAWCRSGGAPSPGTAWTLAALALARPEGAALAAASVGLWALGAALGSVPRRALAWGAIPVAAIALGPALALLLTGDPRSTGFVAKTLLASPAPDALGALRVAMLRAASLAGALFFGIGPRADGLRLYAYESETAVLFVPPGAGILFLAGVLPAIVRELRERRAGPGLLAAMWVGLLLLATSLLEEPDAHFGRYQMPILPPFLTYVAIGVGRLARTLREAPGGLARLADGVRVLLAVGGAASLVFFALAYGDNCEDIDRMQIRTAEWLRTSLPAEAAVAVNDAGALAYFSDRRTVDLIGLTTPGFAGLRAQGSGVLGEKLEAMPVGRRPDWFCIFPNWFEFEPAGILRRVGSVRLLTPSIVDAEKVLYRADWSLAGSGDEPRESPFGRLVDRVDVADPDSERSHRFRWRHDEHGAVAGSFWRRGAVDGGDEILDGGRTVFGEVRFEIERDPLASARLVLRTVSGLGQVALVSVDGGEERAVEIPAAGGGGFHEQALAEIPSGTGRSRVRIRPAASPVGGPLVLCHFFAVTGSE
jgi:hypothetical protein